MRWLLILSHLRLCGVMRELVENSESVHTVVQMPSTVKVKRLAFPEQCSWVSLDNWPSLLAGGVWLVLGG